MPKRSLTDRTPDNERTFKSFWDGYIDRIKYWAAVIRTTPVLIGTFCLFLCACLIFLLMSAGFSAMKTDDFFSAFSQSFIIGFARLVGCIYTLITFTALVAFFEDARKYLSYKIKSGMIAMLLSFLISAILIFLLMSPMIIIEKFRWV